MNTITENDERLMMTSLLGTKVGHAVSNEIDMSGHGILTSQYLLRDWRVLNERSLTPTPLTREVCTRPTKRSLRLVHMFKKRHLHIPNSPIRVVSGQAMAKAKHKQQRYLAWRAQSQPQTCVFRFIRFTYSRNALRFAHPRSLYCCCRVGDSHSQENLLLPDFL